MTITEEKSTLFTRARSRDARETILRPSDGQSFIWGASSFTDPAPAVTEATTLGLPAAWRALNLISHGVAAMVPEAFDGSEKVDTPLVIARPNPTRTRYETYAEMTATLMLYGNYFAVLADEDERGFARQFLAVHPDLVQTVPHEGRIYYLIGEEVFRDDEMLHIRGFTMPGNLTGVGVISAHRRGLGLAVDTLSYGATSMRTGGVPSALIQVDRKELTSEQAAEIQTRWLEAHGTGQRKPAVVGNLVNVTPLSFSPADAEYIESRKLSVADVALMFGLKPEDLGVSMGGQALTYQNLETAQLERIQNAFMPWVLRIEQSLSDLLPGSQFVRLNNEALLRPDRMTRYQAYEIGIRSGVLTVEEARAMEGLTS